MTLALNYLHAKKKMIRMVTQSNNNNKCCTLNSQDLYVRYKPYLIVIDIVAL